MSIHTNFLLLNSSVIISFSIYFVFSSGLLLGLLYDDLNNNIKEAIKTIPKDYYKRILNWTYIQKDYIKKINQNKFLSYYYCSYQIIIFDQVSSVHTFSPWQKISSSTGAEPHLSNSRHEDFPRPLFVRHARTTPP